MTEKEKKSARERSKKYYHANKQKKKLYQEVNKDKIKEKKKIYWIENKGIFKEKKKTYYKNNKVKISQKQKKRFLTTPKKHKAITEKDKIRNKIYEKLKLKTDPLFKLKKKIRTSIGNAFRNNHIGKKSKTVIILGCSFEEFKTYIESKFEYWMTWENYGKYNGQTGYGWDLDHIVPISTAKTEEEIIKLSHHTNFQPLCSYTNRVIKRNK